MIRCARAFTWADNLLDRADAEGMNNADADKIDVKRKADWDRTKGNVWIAGSSPHRV